MTLVSGRCIFVLFLLLSWSRAHAQTSPRCGAAHDLMIQALERVGPDSAMSVVGDSNQLLKRSEQMCSEMGDTWYYRSLFEARLGNARAAAFSLSQAKRLGSQAMDAGVSPFILSTPSPGATPTAPLTGGTRWALVVGVSKFDDASIQPLKYAADDARLFAATLEDKSVGDFPANQVRLLVDDAATTTAIRAGLNWIARSAKPQDLVVIYVATHGSARDLDSVGGANYLVTEDTRLGPNRDQDLLFGSALPMNDLVATVANRISALRTAIFIDTCFSGSTDVRPHGVSVSERDLQRFGQGQGRIIMSAARADQESRESDDLHHGYFTYYLVEALKSPGTPHLLDEVYRRVAKDVSQRVRNDTSPMSEHQDPVLSRSSEQTDFALNESAE